MKINKVENYLIENPLPIIILMSIISVVTFGVSVYLHVGYNLDLLDTLLNNSDQNSGVWDFRNSPFNIMYYYTKYIVPFLDYGFIIFITAFIVKVLQYYLVYKIAKLLLSDEGNLLPLAISMLYIFAPMALVHGVVNNGLFNSPVLFNASLSSLATLSGLIFLVRKRYLWSGVLFSLSIHFHPLYGVTALAWLGIGVLIIGWYQFSSRDWFKFIVALLLIIGSILYISYFSLGGNNDYSVNFIEWYKYIYSINPDDVSLIFTFEAFGYGILPIFLFSTYLSLINSKKDIADYFMIGFAVSLSVFMVLEFLHRNGFFFGTVSEYFLIIEFRRGIWLCAIVSLIIIVKNRTYIFESLKDNEKLFLLGMSVAVYLAPSAVTILLLLVYIVYLFGSRLIYLLFVLVSFMIYLGVQEGHLILVQQIKSIAVFALALITVYVVSLSKNRSNYLVFISVFTVVVGAYLFAGILQGRFANSYSLLAGNGMFNIVDHDIVRANSSSSNHVYDNLARECITDLSSKLDRRELIQLPITLIRFHDEAFYRKDLYFSAFNISLPGHSKYEYKKTIMKLKIMFGEKVVDDFIRQKEFYSKSEFMEYFNDFYTNLLVDKLNNLYMYYNMRFYLLQNKRDDLGDYYVCSGKKYHVYDLSLISIDE